MSSQNVTLKCRGLYTFPNALSEVPDGALSETNNVVIDRDGVVNPRRGFTLYGDAMGTSGIRAKQLLLYRGRILRHWSTKIDVDSNGSGTFVVMKDQDGADAAVTETSSGTRIKYVEANGNLYFTSNSGIRKISCLNVADITSKPITPAGGVKALDGDATLNSQTGWFVQDSVVAYRVVWGIKDDNTNVVLGSPSQQIIIANPLLSLLITDFNTMVSDLALAAAFIPFTLTGDTTNTSPIIANITTTNLSVGMTVAGTGIPVGATIITVGSTTITLSANATATNVGTTLTFDQKLHDTDYATLRLSSNSSATVVYTALTALASGASNKLDNDMGGTTFQSITPPSAPTTPPTSAEELALQEYFDAIINALNTTTGIARVAKAPFGGAFSNSTQSATTNVIFTIPQSITTAYFYQIYRSALFIAGPDSSVNDVVPDDELRLIYESNPTSADIVNKYVNFFDNIPDSFRVGGANLYTNANSGEGIAQANEPPPLSTDIALFKGSTFYSNTKSLYSKEIGLLTATGLAGGSLTIAQGSTVNKYTFVAEVAQITQITAIAGASFVNVGTSDYFDIYSADSIAHYRVWFQSGTSVAPSGTGVTLVQITLTGVETDAQVAVKIQTALTNLNDFAVSTSTNIATVVNETSGYTTSPTENVANAGFLISVTTTGTGEDAATLKIGVSAASTPAQEVDETARSIVRVINKNALEKIYAYYISGPDDVPGLILLQARTLSDSKFYIKANSNTISQKFNPDLGSYSAISGISMANPTVVTANSHGLVAGDTIVISNSDSTPIIDGIQTVVAPVTSNTFTLNIDVTVAGTSASYVRTSLATGGDNEVVPNRIYYSKYQQPEAVPIVNFQDVGPKNQPILRILPLRDSLFILSTAGVYRLAGDTVENFQISLFDSSAQLKATDSATVLNNQIYMFSGQGISTISDTGTGVQSRPIENLLLPLVTSAYTNFVTATFGVAYESDRSYLLFTITNADDVEATVVYRFNTFTNTWVSWSIAKTCGVINTDQDKLYLGAADTNYIEVERKSFTRLDHADRQTDLIMPIGGISNTVMSLGSLFGTTVGDVFVQNQNLTISQLNRLLKRIDTDTGLNQKDYFSTLQAFAGYELRDSLTLLATKLDSDSGLASHAYVASIAPYTNSFSDTQAAFNVIVGLLNTDANTRIKNYATSIGTVSFEVPVVAVNALLSKITLAYLVPFIAGTVVQYVRIDSSVVWVPHHFGDASLLKHVSESTILFENVDFTEATASYSSDLSPGFEAIPIMGEGTGIWGFFDWGQVVWGGEGTSRPFRTLVPANKQRCRYINGQFAHRAAFEKYAVFGISYTFTPISSRAYR